MSNHEQLSELQSRVHSTSKLLVKVISNIKCVFRTIFFCITDYTPVVVSSLPAGFFTMDVTGFRESQFEKSSQFSNRFITPVPCLVYAEPQIVRKSCEVDREAEDTVQRPFC